MAEVEVARTAQRLQEAGAQLETFDAADGYRITYAHYRAESTPRAVVACIHGIQSHAGWYTGSCQALSRAGFETCFMDRRGSGQNTADRGHCQGYVQLCDDLARFIAELRRRHPGLPVTLLAISWGGKLAVATLKEHPDLVENLVLMCPGWFAKVAPTLREKLAIGWSFLLWPKRLINVPLSDPALFTATPSWQQFLREDPLSIRRATARTLMSSRLLDSVISDAPSKISVPSLLMLAGNDRIIDNDQTERYFSTFASQSKTVLRYADAHHTLEFEPDREAIFADLISWLEPQTLTKS